MKNANKNKITKVKRTRIEQESLELFMAVVIIQAERLGGIEMPPELRLKYKKLRLYS